MVSVNRFISDYKNIDFIRGNLAFLFFINTEPENSYGKMTFPIVVYDQKLYIFSGGDLNSKKFLFIKYLERKMVLPHIYIYYR
jgi:hypothetical protein